MNNFKIKIRKNIYPGASRHTGFLRSAVPTDFCQCRTAQTSWPGTRPGSLYNVISALDFDSVVNFSFHPASERKGRSGYLL